MKTHLAIDKLDIVWALSIAVTGSVLGAGLVSRVFGLSTISFHLREVESSVETAGEVGYIDVEGEFHLLELEHLVGAVAIGHEVNTGPDVGRVWAVGDEFHGEGIAGGRDTVGAAIITAVESAVLGACGRVGAEGRVPGVASIAVGGSRGGMEPAPVGVKNDGSLVGGATSRGRACLPGHRGMGLGSESTSLLAIGHGEEREGQECSCGEHDNRWKT